MLDAVAGMVDGVLPGITGGGEASLSDYAGKPLVLVFYPGDDTPVCTKQLNSYNDDLSQFEAPRARTLAARLNSGRRAASVAVDEISSLSGMLTPGDLIDRKSVV